MYSYKECNCVQKLKSRPSFQFAAMAGNLQANRRSVKRLWQYKDFLTRKEKNLLLNTYGNNS